MKAKGKLLIVDDNSDLLAGLKLFLSPHVASITTLRNPNLIPDRLRREFFDVVLLDMNFSAGINSGNEGLYWMRRILEVQPLVSVVLITAYGDVELAVKAMKEGATDFIQKTWDEEKILSSVLTAITIGQSRREIQDLRQKQKHLSEDVSRKSGGEREGLHSNSFLRVDPRIYRVVHGSGRVCRGCMPKNCDRRPQPLSQACSESG